MGSKEEELELKVQALQSELDEIKSIMSPEKLFQARIDQVISLIKNMDTGKDVELYKKRKKELKVLRADFEKQFGHQSKGSSSSSHLEENVTSSC